MTLSDLKDVYLIHSGEELLLERALRRLRGRFAEAGGADFDIAEYDGDSADIDDVMTACNTLPLLAERRLVVLMHADRLDKRATDVLAGYAADPSPTTVLVLTAEKVNKGSRLYKSVDALGGVAEYKAPRRGEYPAFMSELVAEKGRRLPADAAAELVRLVGQDLQRLSSEAEKVIAYAGERLDLNVDDVRQVVSSSVPTTVFQLKDALASRDCVAALRLIDQLVGQGESVHGLHAMSVRTVRDLIAAQTLAERGERGTAALAAQLGRQEWQVRDLPRQAQRFACGELSVLLRAAADTEAQMKASRDPRLAYERWVLAVCGGAPVAVR